MRLTVSNATTANMRDLWTALRWRVLPSKFIYIFGAQIEDILQDDDAKEQNAYAVAKEVTAISQVLKRIHWPLYFTDIGPGNGRHSFAVLAGLADSGYEMDHYLGLDISSAMLQLSSKRIGKYFRHLPISAGLWDLEDGPTDIIFRTYGHNPTVVTMLGNTLAGVEDTVVSLRNIAISCGRGDMLILHVNRVSNQNDASILYRFRSELITRSILSPLAAAGIDTEGGYLDINYSHDLETVVGTFVFTRDETIEWEGQSLSFSAGETIRCFLSRRFTDNSVERILDGTGWCLSNALSDASGIHAIYVCQRTDI